MATSPDDQRDSSPSAFREIPTLEAVQLEHQHRHGSPGSPPSTSSSSPRNRSTPGEAEIRALIDAARAHPLGLDFLKTGSLDSVPAMFSVHAFVVEHARATLGDA